MTTIRQSGPIFAVAALLALWLKILVPHGMMLTPTSGGFVMTVCSDASGGGTGTVVLEGKTKPASDKPEQPCGFAVSAAPGLLPTALPVVLPRLFYGSAAPKGRAGTVAIGHGLAAPPPPATGPPRFV
jgi:hypothetical protein